MAKKSDKEREIDYLEIEKSRINREKARLVVNMGLILYFGFLIVGIIGFTFDYVDSTMLNVLVICGIVILVVSTLPYLIIVHNEDRWINSKIQELKNEK
ncbi:MAG: hypothetical protein KKC75_08875 [Nanoarchaeota archaeon]|nr:hypothetical protein [Nanoarchaeota archaeon]MBU1005695.1 hypothetical protein [Nanoarchaeota archaeon]MBU1946414.1 hypothetical protein [Nanoarchaeota archaeon]